MAAEIDTKSKLRELFALFESRPRLLILIHPDPDSIASAQALRQMLLRKCSKIAVAIDEPIKRLQNQAMVRLLKIGLVEAKQVKFSDFDFLAVTDGQRDHFPILSRQKVDICIDHHPLVKDRGYRFSDLRTDYGATSSILAEYLEAARIKTSSFLATALCYGIKTDTDNFTRNVHRSDAIAFSKLFPSADYYLLRSIDQVEISLRHLGLFSSALGQLKVRRKRVIIHLGLVPSTDLLVIIADFLIRVSEIEMVLVSGFADPRLTVILRNRNPRRDIGLLAKNAFEPPGVAGGHRYAARAELPGQCIPKKAKAASNEKVIQWLERRIARAGSKASPPRGREDEPCEPLSPESSRRLKLSRPQTRSNRGRAH